MNKIVTSELISLDGYFAGVHDEIDWHHVDGEFNEYATELLDGAGTLVFGRVTYDLMAGFWPTEAAQKADPVISKKMHDHPKAVFSRTMKKADWAGTKVVHGDLEAEVRKLREESDGYVLVLGSGQLLTQMAVLGLVDEYRILVNPVILGAGKPLFGQVPERIELTLERSHTFRSGMIALYYRPAEISV